MLTTTSLKTAWTIAYPISLGIFNFCLVITVWLWFKHPNVLLRLINWFQVRRSGAASRRIHLPNGTTIKVLEKGAKEAANMQSTSPILLFLHGFGESAMEWLPVMELIPSHEAHIVAIDLLGHGSSRPSKRASSTRGRTVAVPQDDTDAEESYSLSQLADTLHQALDAMGHSKRRLHLVGHSLGGLLAVMLANGPLAHSVELITLIAPFGFYGKKNEFFTRLEEGYCSWLLPMNMDEYRIHLRKRQYKFSSQYEQLLQGQLMDRLQHHSAFLSVLRSLTTSNHLGLVLEDVGKITQPVSIIWGAQDEILPCSSMELLRQRLMNCVRADQLNECGHAAHVEQAENVVKVLMLFRKDYELKKFK